MGRKNGKRGRNSRGKDLEVQVGDVTRVVGGRAGALVALTN